MERREPLRSFCANARFHVGKGNARKRVRDLAEEDRHHISVPLRGSAWSAPKHGFRQELIWSAARSGVGQSCRRPAHFGFASKSVAAELGADSRCGLAPAPVAGPIPPPPPNPPDARPARAVDRSKFFQSARVGSVFERALLGSADDLERIVANVAGAVHHERPMTEVGDLPEIMDFWTVQEYVYLAQLMLASRGSSAVQTQELEDVLAKLNELEKTEASSLAQEWSNLRMSDQDSRRFQASFEVLRLPRFHACVSKVLRVPRKMGAHSRARQHPSPLDSSQTLPLPRKRKPRCTKYCACHDFSTCLSKVLRVPRKMGAHSRARDNTPALYTAPKCCPCTQTQAQVRKVLHLPLRLPREMGAHSRARHNTPAL